MKKLFKFMLVVFGLLSIMGGLSAQNYSIKGSQFAIRNKLITYVILPKADSLLYNWFYSDTTLQRISIPGEDTAVFYTKTIAKSGVISCELKDSISGTVLDTVDFPLAIIERFVDVSSLAALSLECAGISNDNNDCKANYIDYFEIKDLKYQNNGCVVGGYQDLTSSGYTTVLDMGLNYTVVLKPKEIYKNTVGEDAKLFYGIWLDYNNDGDFDDPGEFIKEGESNELTANIINIEILNNDAYAGSRRLRVGMNSSSGFTSGSACTVISAAGEMEDYLVKINKVGALYGPNFLTPNNDGFNDYLVIKGIDPDESKARTLEVFDSFGHKVRTIDNYQNDFDCKDEEGNLISKGIYYYVFTNDKREFKSYFQVTY